MRNVERVDMHRKIAGQKSRLPFFIAPAAMARLAHDDGEFCLARGAARAGIPYCPSSYSSIAHSELASCLESERKFKDEGCLFFQLYVNKSKDQTLELIRTARTLGCKALVITVDTAVVGKREEDERYRAELEYESGEDSPIPPWTHPNEDTPVLRGYHSATLNWSDLPWIREAWGSDTGPIALKGIQTAEDALLAAEAGVDAIYLSNHGGRQCDDAPSSIRTLLEIRKFFPDVLDRMEVYMDGGFRRGADILKAIALGATAVAMGRPFMYALGAYGTDGVMKAIKILSDEIETTMRLIGVTSLDQLNPSYVNTKVLEKELPDGLAPVISRVKSKL